MVFLIDDNPMGMMSAQIIEGLVFIIIFFTLLFSSLALFFKGRRKARKLDYKFWNAKTKSTFFKHLLSFLFIFIIIYLLSVKGLIDFIAPVFLILYGLLLYVLKIKKSKTLYVLSSVCFLLALLCFFIPNYWYSSIFILGIAHITYGIVVKN